MRILFRAILKTGLIALGIKLIITKIKRHVPISKTDKKQKIREQ